MSQSLEANKSLVYSKYMQVVRVRYHFAKKLGSLPPPVLTASPRTVDMLRSFAGYRETRRATRKQDGRVQVMQSA